MANDNFEAGMKVRRAVLGDAHVDRAYAIAKPILAERAES